MRIRLLNIVLVSLAAFTCAWGESPLIEKGWQPAEKQWDRSLGTHRVIVKVDAPAAAVKADLEWRRPDREPEKKAVIVVDVKTGQPIANVITLAITNVSGQILFQPTSGAGEYAVYFLPVKIDGGAFPTSKYKEPQEKADAAWVAEAKQSTALAIPVKWEALTVMDRWNEMEVIATPAETAKLAATLPKGVMTVVSGPQETVHMANHLPAKWIHRKPTESIPVPTHAGANAVFQVVVWAGKDALKNVTVEFPRELARSPELVKSEVTCLTTSGTNWNGDKISRTFDIPAGVVQPFWCTVPLPADLKADGSLLQMGVVVKADGKPIATPQVTFQLNPAPAVPEDGQPQSLSRLRWLNSQTAMDDEPAKGYTALTVKGKTIGCLGREVELGDNGLPVRITSFYNSAVTKTGTEPTQQLLREGARMVIIGPDGSKLALAASGFQFTKQTPGVVEWVSQWKGGGVKAALRGRMEFDGSVLFKVALEADSTLSVQDVRLEIPRTPETTEYLLGLQHETGKSIDAWEWKWDVVNRNQDSVWLGAVNGGLRVLLKSDNYVRPGVNIHYRRRPLNDPPSWSGDGKGGMTYANHQLNCYSGPRTLEAGKPLHFDFDLLVTPFHPLQTKEQWNDRYYHTGGVPKDVGKYLDGAKSAGANVVNIHQGNYLNPYINYPFLTWELLRDFSKAAHDRNMRAKYYYTVRELTNWAPEIFALRSMGDEILLPGKGGGHPWGEEHLAGNYWQAWYEPGVQDVSFLTQPMSRWHNYYVEGLKWLCENAGCDGIYLDDIAYDRSIMLRARKVLDRHVPRGGLIDLHSWNEFNDWACRAHCPNIFMDSLPFVDRIWFGEGHHYTGPPAEHFLVELSGIPFGLMGEMLEGGGNPWFGLVHGMTGRLGWQGNPRNVWKVWDDFGLEGSEFIGWWAGKDSPVQTGDAEVKATLWKKPGATLLALANFAKTNRKATLQIDWKALGLDPKKVKFYQPPVLDLKQREALLPMDQPLLVKAYSGVVLVLDERERALQPSAALQGPGEVMLLEDFSKGLGAEWKPMISDKVKSPPTADGGYVLNAPANVHAFLERKLPETAGGVSARIWQDGKDEGQQWGPGLALVWPNGNTLKVSIRQDQRITVSVNGGDDMPGSMTSRAVVELRVHWDEDNISIIAGGPAMGDLDEELVVLPRAKFSGQPSLLRVGKMPNNAAAQDFDTPGPIGFNRFENVKIYAARK